MNIPMEMDHQELQDAGWLRKNFNASTLLHQVQNRHHQRSRPLLSICSACMQLLPGFPLIVQTVYVCRPLQISQSTFELALRQLLTLTQQLLSHLANFPVLQLCLQGNWIVSQQSTQTFCNSRQDETAGA